ncbi:MAG: C2H2-type zinc finger protein [Candidatus Manganitrophus sp.]|nr:C2H2-type zinc finger protein [Candidatus Manganitrophus sp.]MDC4223203.1 C2H2-type zinc finger protein [Candidatus Manganitrophus sp.]WDT71065.1 MAG: C2H2-type zinc finger protein [Candidatus Manganitrophus sp.]WDT76690.1 MAG: C2H2-type zinc finger protein [Candidatus Manganitrophus sp.]WDT81653.1 MAG: C2H2-type zinc finger protein [Candidatus Manganitrophus sp.]
MAEWKCQDCGKVFKTQQDLLAHELEHAPRYECAVCGEEFKTKEEAYLHEVGKHGRPPATDPVPIKRPA